MLETTGHPGEFLYPIKKVEMPGAPGCFYDDFDMSDEEKRAKFRYTECRHEPGGCKCLRILLLHGQDECIVASKLASLRQWIMEKKMPLRAKSEGPGVMLSQFVNEYTGLCLDLTPEDIIIINDHLQAIYPQMPPLSSGAEIEYFVYGNDKMGYWNNDTFKEQVIKYRLCVQHKWPMYQHALEVDHSSGHMAASPDALSVSHMNMNCGGKQSIMHATELTEECLGGEDIGDRIPFKPGDVQTSYFTSNPNYPNNEVAPFYKPEMPRLSREMSEEEQTEKAVKEAKKVKDKEKRFNQNVMKLMGQNGLALEVCRGLLIEKYQQTEQRRLANAQAKILKEAKRVNDRRKREIKARLATGDGADDAVGIILGGDAGNARALEIREHEDDAAAESSQGSIMGWEDQPKGTSDKHPC